MENGDTMTKEAGEHIENLNSSIHLKPAEMICKVLHGDVVRALVWCIRKIEALFKLIEKNATDSYDKRQRPCRTLKLWPGSQIPLERGFTPRDAIALVLVMGIFYIIIQFHRTGVF